MRDDRPRSSRLAATLIALGLSLAAGGIAFNLWMFCVQELSRARTGRISSEDAPKTLNMMSSYLVAAFVLVTAFVLGSFVIIRAGRFFVDRLLRSPRTDRLRSATEELRDEHEFGPDPRRELFESA